MKKHYLHYIVPVICLLLIAGYLLGNQNISVETILSFTSQDPLKAAVALVLLYVLKSITIFFPVIILEIAVGHIFPPLIAFIINSVGMLIILTLPYLIGRLTGITSIQNLIHEYPRFEAILGKQQEKYYWGHWPDYQLCYITSIKRNVKIIYLSKYYHGKEGLPCTNVGCEHCFAEGY